MYWCSTLSTVGVHQTCTVTIDNSSIDQEEVSDPNDSRNLPSDGQKNSHSNVPEKQSDHVHNN